MFGTAVMTSDYLLWNVDEKNVYRMLLFCNYVAKIEENVCKGQILSMVENIK